jgi:hypothetical protein
MTTTNSNSATGASKHHISETGHAKNVANFEQLLAACTGFGNTYNPNKTTITVQSMKALLKNAQDSINAVNQSIPAYRSAVSERESVFEPLSALATRIINALKSSDVTPQVIESAKTYIRKIQGRRATPKKAIDSFVTPTTKASLSETATSSETGTDKEIPDTTDTHKEISASQMSYDSRLDNFDKLIKLLSSITEYAPNEDELKITTLSTLYSDLRDINTTVVNSTIPLLNTRILRNDILYKDKVGLFYVASDAKSYVKSLYGATSPQYKAIGRLKFTKPAK